MAGFVIECHTGSYSVTECVTHLETILATDLCSDAYFKWMPYIIIFL